jgi:hypothetical protein
MTSGDLEEVLQQNLVLRHELAIEVAKAVEPVPFKWWRERFGRSEDQPLFFAYWSFLSQSHSTSFYRRAFSCLLLRGGAHKSQGGLRQASLLVETSEEDFRVTWKLRLNFLSTCLINDCLRPTELGNAIVFALFIRSWF